VTIAASAHARTAANRTIYPLRLMCACRSDREIPAPVATGYP
jgi:hypothetical protein